MKKGILFSLLLSLFLFSIFVWHDYWKRKALESGLYQDVDTQDNIDSVLDSINVDVEVEAIDDAKVKQEAVDFAKSILEDIKHEGASFDSRHATQETDLLEDETIEDDFQMLESSLDLVQAKTVEQDTKEQPLKVAKKEKVPEVKKEEAVDLEIESEKDTEPELQVVAIEGPKEEVLEKAELPELQVAEVEAKVAETEQQEALEVVVEETKITERCEEAADFAKKVVEEIEADIKDFSAVQLVDQDALKIKEEAADFAKSALEEIRLSVDQKLEVTEVEIESGLEPQDVLDIVALEQEKEPEPEIVEAEPSVDKESKIKKEIEAITLELEQAKKQKEELEVAQAIERDMQELEVLFLQEEQQINESVKTLEIAALDNQEISKVPEFADKIDMAGKVEAKEEIPVVPVVSVAKSRYAPPENIKESSGACEGDLAKEERWWEEFTKPSVLFLGNFYNHALVESFLDRRWVINASFHHALDFHGFNSCGQSVPLSTMLFGKLRIMDVFLLSKLSYDSKLYMEDMILPLANSRAIRNRREDQYLAYLAPFNILIDAERREKWVDFGAFYRFGLGQEEEVICSVGFNVPVKSSTHIMSMDLAGVDLRNHGFTDGDNGDIQFVLGDFKKHFIDVMDFFKRVILDPKGLRFSERQHKVGVGDISLFTFFDLNRLTKKVDGLQVGLDLVLPSGNKHKGCEVWEVILGNGGAFQLGFSANALFKTSKKYFNPSIGLGGKVSFEFESCRRVPKLKTNSAEEQILAEDVGELIVPVFNSHYVRKFAEYDSCIHYFADQTATTKTKLGGIAFLSLGNYFYNVFKEAFRLAFFYDFFYKARDNVYVCAKDGIYNTCALEEYTDMHANQISWNLAYVSKVGVEVNAGSKHVLGGKNFPKTHSLFASIVANF